MCTIYIKIQNGQIVCLRRDFLIKDVLQKKSTHGLFRDVKLYQAGTGAILIK